MTFYKLFWKTPDGIIEYNLYRKVVFYKIKETLDIGSHNIRIEIEDNSKNKASIKGRFYIK